jgi:hypothetical protein
LDVRITVVQCDTGKAILTGRAILRYIDGGSFAEIATTFCIAPVWVRGVIYAGETIPQSTDSSSLTRTAALPEPKKPRGDIELSSSADEYTATATFEFFDAADQLIRTGCATSTATRLE